MYRLDVEQRLKGQTAPFRKPCHEIQAQSLHLSMELNLCTPRHTRPARWDTGETVIRWAWALPRAKPSVNTSASPREPPKQARGNGRTRAQMDPKVAVRFYGPQRQAPAHSHEGNPGPAKTGQYGPDHEGRPATRTNR